MSTELSIRINGQDEAQTALKRLADKSSRPEGGLKLIGVALLKEQNRRFDTQSDPDGKPWAKLAPLTVALRGGKTGPILRRSGQLKRSGAWRLSGSSLRVGVNTPYAAVQNFGATITPKNGSILAIPHSAGFGGKNRPGIIAAKSVTIPARPIVGFGARDEKATLEAVEDWLAFERD